VGDAAAAADNNNNNNNNNNNTTDSLKKRTILEHQTSYRSYRRVKLEAWAVGITAVSREVPVKKGL
jgi:hypothetical protein